MYSASGHRLMSTMVLVYLYWTTGCLEARTATTDRKVNRKGQRSQNKGSSLARAERYGVQRESASPKVEPGRFELRKRVTAENRVLFAGVLCFVGFAYSTRTTMDELAKSALHIQSHTRSESKATIKASHSLSLSLSLSRICSKLK